MTERVRSPLAADGGYQRMTVGPPIEDKLEIVMAARFTVAESIILRRLAMADGVELSKFLRKHVLLALKPRL